MRWRLQGWPVSTVELAGWRVPGSSAARHPLGHRLDMMQCHLLVSEQLTLLR